jgi:hypothetical protein
MHAFHLQQQQQEQQLVHPQQHFLFVFFLAMFCHLLSFIDDKLYKAIVKEVASAGFEPATFGFPKGL